MDEADKYEDYLQRWTASRGQRKKLSLEDHNRLSYEYVRLVARMDPDDIQLDEWKRAEELRFLLVLPSEGEDEEA